MDRLVNAWCWTAAVLVVLLGFPVVALTWLLTAPFDPGRYHAGRMFRRLAVVHTALNPYWHFRTTGRRIDDPRRPYMVVSNHESYADIFLISHLPWEMKWLAKDTIFRIPVMGWMMRMAGDVPLDRASRASGEAAIARCRDRLAKRVSVMIFPEGTRSRDGMLQPFKDGAFRLAVQTGVPILPLVVAGTRGMMAKGSFRFRPAHAEVRVLDPVPVDGLGPADVPALRERVRLLIAATRRQMALERGEPAAPLPASDLAPHPGAQDETTATTAADDAAPLRG